MIKAVEIRTLSNKADGAVVRDIVGLERVLALDPGTVAVRSCRDSTGAVVTVYADEADVRKAILIGVITKSILNL